MTFTTVTFLVFLAVVFGLYWLVQQRGAQNGILLVASYVFYGWWDYRLCSLIFISSVVDYVVGLWLGRVSRPRGRRALLGVSLACNLGLLGTFKYFNFFADNLVALAGVIGVHLDPVTTRFVLPVGISFYTFQTLSYTIDIYRGHMEPTRRFGAYMTYVAFFPQLVAGPIERARQLLPQFLADRHFDYGRARDGALRILWGFFKKMAVADTLGVIVNDVYAHPGAAPGPLLAFATLCFAFQIYCDFSAYSDIATGVARLLGFELMRNFACPYFSQNMSEFWRRWHISLSTWFRDYVYIPLGGNRMGRGRRGLNVMVTFLLSGLWHGASWGFVTWGGIHGLATLPSVFARRGRVLGPNDVPGGPGVFPRFGSLGRMLLTFVVTCLAWVFFRARTFGEAVLVLRRMGTQVFSPAAYAGFGETLPGDYRLALLLLVGLVMVEWVQRRHEHPLHLERWPRVLRWVVYTLLWWATLYLSAENRADFIYFQF